MLATNCFANINKSISFDKGKLVLKEEQMDSDVFVTVDYKNLEKYGLDGAPSLPYLFLTYYIPDNYSNVSINIKNIMVDTIALKEKIYSIPKSIPTSITKKDVQSVVYKPQYLYPDNPVTIIEDGFISGCNRFIKVKVSPLQYIEAKNQLLFNSQIDFEILYNTESSAINEPNKLQPLYPLVKRDNSFLKGCFRIENEEDWDKAQLLLNNTVSLRSTSDIDLPVYNYVVITSNEFASSFEKLVSWKRLKGFSAGIVTMQDIYNDPNVVGDTISNIYDNAGKLRQYLFYAWRRGTEYVLLAGQDSIVPVRYGTGYDCAPGQSVSLDYDIPSDWYYSELNGNWNIDGDLHYGEPKNQFDYEPDLYVGRLLCKNTEEINNYTDKLLIYEQNPGNGDYSYLRKAFYTQDDELQSMNQAKYIANSFFTVFNDTIIYKEAPNYNSLNPTFPYGTDVISKMEERYGLFSWFGHGDTYGISTSSNSINTSPWHGISSLDSYKGGFEEETGNGLDNLTNDLYPSIAYSIACDVTPFDKYKYYHGSVEFCFGEGFTVAGKYGGPAFLGNTRYGWVLYSYLLYDSFIQELTGADYHLGKAEALSKRNFSSTEKHYLTLSHNLIGCPELQMWSDIPSNIDSLTVSQNGTSLSVSSTENCTISINGLFGNGSYNNKATGYSTTFTNVPPNYIVSASKHNYFTYIAPLYIQNETITGSHYIHADKVYIGNNVTSERTSGDFIVDDDASLIVDATNTVTLSGGFSVELGGCFKIIH